MRGVAFEFRGKGTPALAADLGRALMTAGSLLAPLLIGVALGDLLARTADRQQRGVHRRPAGPAAPLRAVLGLTLLLLCALHGATFLGPEDRPGTSQHRAAALARPRGAVHGRGSSSSR